FDDWTFVSVRHQGMGSRNNYSRHMVEYSKKRLEKISGDRSTAGGFEWMNIRTEDLWTIIHLLEFSICNDDAPVSNESAVKLMLEFHREAILRENLKSRRP